MSGVKPLICPGNNNGCKDQRQRFWIWQLNKRAITSLHKANWPVSLNLKMYGFQCKGRKILAGYLSSSRMERLDLLPRSWQRLINNNSEIRGTSLKGYLYPQNKFNLDLLLHSDHTCLSQAKSQTSYFHTSASSHNSDLDMKYSNAALPTVIGSQITHHKPFQTVCFFVSGSILPAPVCYIWEVQKHLDTHGVCQWRHHIVYIMLHQMWLWAEPSNSERWMRSHLLFQAYCGKRL